MIDGQRPRASARSVTTTISRDERVARRARHESAAARPDGRDAVRGRHLHVVREDEIAAEQAEAAARQHAEAAGQTGVVLDAAAVGGGELAFEAVDAGGAVAEPIPMWTRRAEPFAGYDRTFPAVPRPALPWAWIRPRRVLFLLDLAAAAAVMLAFMHLPHLMPYVDLLEDAGERAALIMIFLVEITLLFMMNRDRTYNSSDRLSRIDDGARLIKNIVLTGATIVLLALLTNRFGHTLDREVAGATAFALLVFYVLLTTNRVSMWWWQRRMFVRGEGLRRVVVLGVEHEAAAFREFLHKRPWLGLHLVGGIQTLEREDDQQVMSAVPPVGRVLGGLSELDTVLAETDAHELVVALDAREREVLPRLLRTLHRGRLPYSVMPQLFEGTYRLAPDAEIYGVPVFNVEFEPRRRIARWVKRAMDVGIAGAVLVLLSPLLLLVAAVVKLTSPGPVFFRQQRVGRGGRPFEMLKFRTMYVDAEERLGEVQHLNSCEGPLFKAADDPRMTRVGRFLRRWSIDELPQSINVLRGEMSLVGPRPPLPREVALYATPQCARLKGKPGITGLWQVSGRSELSFAQMVALDRRYLEHWSLRLDLRVIWRTLGAVVKRRGAY